MPLLKCCSGRVNHMQNQRYYKWCFESVRVCVYLHVYNVKALMRWMCTFSIGQIRTHVISLSAMWKSTRIGRKHHNSPMQLCFDAHIVFFTIYASFFHHWIVSHFLSVLYFLFPLALSHPIISKSVQAFLVTKSTVCTCALCTHVIRSRIKHMPNSIHTIIWQSHMPFFSA